MASTAFPAPANTSKNSYADPILDQLQAENAALKQALADERAEKEALRLENERLYRIVEDEVWNEDVMAMKKGIANPQEKLVYMAYRKIWPSLAKNEYGLAESPVAAIAAMTSVPYKSVQTVLTRGKKLGIINKPDPEPRLLINEITGRPLRDSRTGKPRFDSTSFSAPTELFDDPSRWHAQPALVHPPSGGKRTKREIPTCPTCGEPATKEHAHLECANEHTWDVYTDFEAESQNEIREDDPQIPNWEPKYVIASQIEISEQQDDPITPPQDWRTVLTPWLEKRIGAAYGLIWKTGKEDPKYLPLIGPYSIVAYLAGLPGEIYGSRLRQADGKTWVLTFDFDDDQPEHDELHEYYMIELASAGITSLYFPRRKGRGHLEIYFDAPVDPQAAYQWMIGIVPDLARVEECYPVKGVQDTQNQPLSWPLYQRIGDEVTECRVEAMFASTPGIVEHCAGVKSDPEHLAQIVSRCVTSSSLIPEIPIAPKPQETAREGGALLDKPWPKTVYDGDLIEDFNRTHSWDEIVAMCGGYDQRGYFKAVWRSERTASVRVDKKDDSYCCDYGNHGSFPKKLDKYGVYCLVRDIDSHTDLNERRAALRQEVAA